MRLPLRLRCENYGETLVVDADHRVITRLHSPDIKFARAMVRKFNRDWRWLLFGMQPYVYTREDWLFERNTSLR